MALTHLVDKGRLFDEIAVNYSGAEATGIQIYRSQSKNLIMVARMLRDFSGANVLDVACGFGITALAVAGHGPASITSIDPSGTLTDLAKLIMQSDEDISAWYERHDGRQLLGQSFQRTVNYITALRHGFREHLFFQQSRPISILKTGLMEFAPQRTYDIVVMNNALHWVVTQIRQQKTDPNAPETIRAALVEALQKVRGLLNSGGLFVFLSLKIFIEFEEPELEAHFTAHAFQNHSIIKKLNTTIRDIFETELGIVRKTGAPPPFIYHHREMPQVAQESGFRLVRTVHLEETFLPPNVLEYFQLLIPINLGDIEVPMAEKVRVVDKAAARIRSEISALPENRYIYDHHHIFALVAE